MWVFDGDGKNLNYLPDPEAPWAPDANSPTGDRHSASMVSALHPYLFACFACDPDSQFKDGLVLAPTQQTRSRLMCAIHGDIGTIRYKCSPPGRSDACRPGCGPNRCGDPPHRTWMCSWDPSDMKRMMETHDWMGTGYTGPFEPGMWPYNELIFDAWTQPWDPDIAHIVEAVFVQKRGTDGDLEHARRVHDRLLRRVGASSESLPLVEYDPAAEAGVPFRELAV